MKLRPLQAAVLLATWAAVTPEPASANGRFPQAQHMIAGPGPRDDLLAVRTTFGLIASEDGGGSFRFLCEDLFEYLDGFDPAITWTANGTLLVGIRDGLYATRDRCDPVRRDDLDRQYVVDLTTDPTGMVVLAALQSRDSTPVMRFARSDDAGMRFTMSQDGMAGVVPLTVEIAPSDTRRAYASAVVDPYNERAPVFVRSDDGGRAWRRTRAVFPGLADVYVSGVDPSRPDVVWARARPRDVAGDGGALDAGAVLLRSDDGGESFREVTRTQGPMRGFALSGDGTRVWIGGPDLGDGLRRSEGGGPFQQVARAAVDCLRWHAGALYVCEALGTSPTLLSRSRDGGETREVVARVQDVLPPPQSCPRGSRTRGICVERWAAVRPMVLARLSIDASTPSRPDATIDATSDPGPPPPRSSCGTCATTPPRTGLEPLVVLTLFTILLSCVRRRDRPGARHTT